MNCPSCGHGNPPGTFFCEGCQTPLQDDNARTQAVPSLDDLLKEDRASHAVRSGAPMPEGEDEDVAAPTEAIDFQALIASGAVPDPAAVLDKSSQPENLATTPLDDGPHPVSSGPSLGGPSDGPSMGEPPPMEAAPPAPAPASGGGDGWAMDGGGASGGGGGGGASAPPPKEEKSKTGLIVGIVGALFFLFCCCPLIGYGGWSGYAYYQFQNIDPGSGPVAVDGDGDSDGSGDAAGGALSSLTGAKIKEVLEAEGYTVATDPVETDTGGAKSIHVAGLKDATAASVILYSYSGPGADTFMDSWKKGAESVDGSHVVVDGTTGLQVTISGNADEAKRLAEVLSGG